MLIDSALPVSKLRWTRTEFGLADTEDTAVMWHRDVMEVVTALVGDPRFTAHLRFAPERHYIDDKKEYRLLSEMWTGNWWWRTQVSMCSRFFAFAVIPLIIGSDKTLLTQHTGDRYGYPVYLTIGNLPKAIRRCPSQKAIIPIALLPTNKFGGLRWSEEKCRIARQRLFHQCLTHLLEPIVGPGTTGIHLKSGDGALRLCYPFLSAYVADYPEQGQVACTMSLRCPQIQEPTATLHSSTGPEQAVDRDTHNNTQHALTQLKYNPSTHTKKGKLRSGMTVIKALSLTPVPDPFFAKLPHCQIHLALFPDILHQLLQGMLKHLLGWITDIMGTRALDMGFQSLPPTHGARFFEHGITTLAQMTGEEYKDMARVLFGLLCGSRALKEAGELGTSMMRASGALMDFYYLASLGCHSEQSVVLLRKALLTFHANKHAFVKLGARRRKDGDEENFFRIPKLHSLVHYMESILEGGALDNFNTSTMEQLHANVKRAFRESSGREDTAFEEMTIWLSRDEAVSAFDATVAWRRHGAYSSFSIIWRCTAHNLQKVRVEEQHPRHTQKAVRKIPGRAMSAVAL
ncbi:hypothetical protein CALCODRAFT_536682 [Calocera cornea HHB12733]|uniref:Uncharacterized protein n=1 Tax=Calocera cornea HHB12733 TaxID=1353952 RepID=A0A165HLQ0_9BASI|nr:hypothetical protein CALCODRAFT_536682 [Calocera cornea HHB12733]